LRVPGRPSRPADEEYRLAPRAGAAKMKREVRIAP
jgi:hypothetical protein